MRKTSRVSSQVKLAWLSQSFNVTSLIIKESSCSKKLMIRRMRIGIVRKRESNESKAIVNRIKVWMQNSDRSARSKARTVRIWVKVKK